MIERTGRSKLFYSKDGLHSSYLERGLPRQRIEWPEDPADFIQMDRIKLIGRSSFYNAKKDEGKYELERVVPRHSIAWPIDLYDQPLHFSCYFWEKNYANRQFEQHRGVDVQVKEGTSVFAPEDCRILKQEPMDPSGLEDVYLQGLESGIFYILRHLEPHSLCFRIYPIGHSDEQHLNFESVHIVKKRETVGNVGRWLAPLRQNVDVPPDVEDAHGRSYHHLHIETHNYRNRGKLKDPFDLSDGYEFNPLILFDDVAPGASREFQKASERQKILQDHVYEFRASL